jgi:hypothetical protein
MATYVELIRQDVYLHEPCEDASLWPSSVSEFESLKNELIELSRWSKSVSFGTLRMQATHLASHKGPVPYTNKCVIDLFNQLRASNNVSNVDLWDSADKSIGEDMMEQRQHVVFNTTLVDCARVMRHKWVPCIHWLTVFRGRKSQQVSHDSNCLS